MHRPLSSSPRLQLRPIGRAAQALAWGWLGCGVAASVAAQTLPATPPAALRLSDALQERLAPDAQRMAPSFVYGERISGETDVRTLVEGQAELRRHDTVLRADRLEHDTATDTVRASGQVRINRLGDVFEGPLLQLKLDTSEGFFLQPRFSLLQSGGHGEADRIDFVSQTVAVAQRARYTTCERYPGGAWMPDWMVSASSITFDQEAETGTATNGVLSFKGVPVLAAPYVSFPLSDRRKSGALPPTFNVDTVSGFEVTLPYYLNLAPNRDATLYPTFMSKRGLDLGGEYRYLESTHSGRLRGAFMPNDRLRRTDRWGWSAEHAHTLTGLGDSGPVNLRLNLNRVSDNDYWRDFPRSSTSLTSRLLANDAVLSWSQGPLALSAGVYRWQTLQDVAEPITPPYDRLPSVGLRYTPAPFALGGLDGWNARLTLDHTRFQSDRAQTGVDINGSRSLAIGELSRTWQMPGGYIKPSLQLHTTQYRTDSALPNGARSATRTLPSLSLDAGLVFERDASLFGRDLLQTLEPRAYYSHTPRRDQSFLPNYDSSAFDFNLDTIFSPTPYGGQDRLADVNALTLGATSRLLDPASGAEIARFGVAQRLRFADQQVVLPGETPISERVSDLLFSAQLNWDPRWSIGGTAQYNPKRGESVRNTLNARYSPGPYRVVSAAYRLQKGSSEQLDIGWQWPLGDLFGARAPDQTSPSGGLGAGQWYSVGRVNYSFTDSQIVDLVAGFEYDAGCWIGRVVLERLQRSSASANQRILFQLEFVGFSRIGSNPLQTLKNNVPRYQYLRENVAAPNRFGRYD